MYLLKWKTDISLLYCNLNYVDKGNYYKESLVLALEFPLVIALEFWYSFFR